MPRKKRRLDHRGRLQADAQRPHFRRLRRTEQPVGLVRRETGDLCRLQPCRYPVRPLDLLFHGFRHLGRQSEPDMHRRHQARIHCLVSRPHRRLDGRDHIPDHIFRRVVQKRRQPPFHRRFRRDHPVNPFHQNRVFRHRIGKLANRLPVPARHECQPVGDILDLDIQRRGVQQVEPAPRKHPLPCACNQISVPFRQSPVLRQSPRIVERVRQ